MKSAIQDAKVVGVLERLHEKANAEWDTSIWTIPAHQITWKNDDALSDKMIPVSHEQGEMLYLLCLSLNAKFVVEYGTSFGLSTIYLAAAMRETGGSVVGTEFVPEKVQKATKNLAEAGLINYVTILEGDATRTLKDVPKPVDLLLMDGFPPYSVEIMQTMMPKIRKGGIVVVDGTEHLRDKLIDLTTWIGDPTNGFSYTELPFADGTGLAVKR